jgi:hypothetical protein
MFLFAQEVDKVLDLIGYDTHVISEFSFIRGWYLRLTEFPPTRNIDLAYFHVLDLTIWLTIAVWANWLVTGVIFLKQYDLFFGGVARRLAKVHRAQLFLFLMAVIAMPFALNYGPRPSRLLRDPIIAWFITQVPMLSFTFFAFIYFVYGFVITFIALFILWKLFRQMWPGAVLWSEEAAERGQAQ